MMLKEVYTTLEPYGASLVAVSKTHPDEAILQLYAEGQRDFGENRVPELVEKYERLPKDIRWHLIGHLQTNKVKYIAGFVALIHSVDSLKLLAEINHRAESHQRVIDVLLQFKIAAEDTKYGLTLAAAEEILRSPDYAAFRHIRVVGVMGMATFTDREEQVRAEFDQLRAHFTYLKTQYFPNEPSFREISMGMSDDYLLALAAGSTMVRIGSLLFGAR